MFAESLGARTIDTTQMRSDRQNSLLKPIKESEDGEILFFDEIHSLQPKILESLYKIIDKGTFYDPELCMDLELPKVRFIFATNIIDKLPVAFCNRCKFIRLSRYTEEELKELVYKRYSMINKNAIEGIVKASKGVPRTALSLAQSIISGAETEKIIKLNTNTVNKMLESRFDIDGDTGLSKEESLIISKVIERGRLSQAAIANLLHISLSDAKNQFIEPLRASDWLAISQQGVVLGFKGHANYRKFIKRKEV